MEEGGADCLSAVAEAVAEGRGKLPSLGYRDAHAGWRDTGLEFDPTRLVINAPQGGKTLAAAFRARGVDAEMYDQRRVVFIMSAMDDPADVRKLATILEEIPSAAAEIPALPMLESIPERALEVREAAMADCEKVPLQDCLGRIVTASAGLYPPGIPLICPGEVVSEEILTRLMHAKNQERFGVEGDTLLCVKL
jgi:arginine/lysine/ornithine decarboxylase